MDLLLGKDVVFEVDAAGVGSRERRIGRQAWQECVLARHQANESVERAGHFYAKVNLVGCVGIEDVRCAAACHVAENQSFVRGANGLRVANLDVAARVYVELLRWDVEPGFSTLERHRKVYFDFVSHLQ